MPTLDWIGKKKVVNHHLDVPFRVLEKKYIYSADNKAQTSENKIIHGDNLEALKSLLPEYEGKIKCIYIDPPYNTGNEGWIYNDNVNDPRIKKWLGEVVGKESEDFTRHDKWLCMMYPRLKLLQKLLSEDGAIFISIDDNEQANLKLICDEIFGSGNFIADVIWKHTQQSKNDERFFARMYNHTIVYAKDNTLLENFKFERTEEDNKNYSNPDNDPKGLWRSGDVRSPNLRQTLKYDIIAPNGSVIHAPEKGWRWSKESVDEKIKTGEIIFKPDFSGIIRKIYLSEQEGRTPENLWEGEKYGTTRSANATLKSIFDSDVPFDTPKPNELIESIISLFPNDSIILDCFAGSGTTAHAVLNMNKSDGGNRKFILIEMMDYAETITAERVKRVIKGYADKEGTGGDYGFYELGEPLLINNLLNEKVDTQTIREYIWFTETKSKFVESKEDNKYFLGNKFGASYFFYYEKEKATTLDFDFLATIKQRYEQYIIYADICLLPADFMQRNNIIFKKIPRDIKKF